MTALATYFSKVRLIRGSGLASDERSYYPALDALFHAVGETLNPSVGNRFAPHFLVDGPVGETLTWDARCS